MTPTPSPVKPGRRYPSPSRLRHRLLRAVLAVALLLGSGVAALPAVLSALTPRVAFRPAPLTAAEASPARWGLPHAREVRFRTDDGVGLHGWWAPTFPGSACGAVVLFHGRSANVTTRAPVARWLNALGYDALLFDYRGYGASDRIRPDEAGVYRDGLAAYRYATGERRAPPGRVVLLGQSMGTAVAAEVAARHPAAGLVLVSPYTSAPGTVRHRLPAWVPDGWPDWRRNRFEVVDRVIRSGEPLVVAASRADRQVLLSESRLVFDAAPGPKRWVEVDHPGHVGLLQHPVLQERLAPALRELLPCSSPA